MRTRLMFLDGGDALGQTLIRPGTEEDIGFLASRLPEQSWDAASLTTPLDETRPDAMINLAFYHDWFRTEQVEAKRLGAQEHAVEHLAKLCQHYKVLLIQPSGYRVFDGARATTCSEKDETLPLGLRDQVLWRMEQSMHAACPRHMLIRFSWLLDENPNGLLGRFLSRAEQPQPLFLADDRRDNPTPADDAVQVVLPVLKQFDCQTPLWGTYHYGGLEATTTLALGQVILNEVRTYRSDLIQKPSAEAHVVRPDALDGPQHMVIVYKRILHTFGIKLCTWRTGLPTLLDRYYRHV